MQGLLLMPVIKMPNYFLRWKKQFKAWFDFCRHNNLKPFDVALNFVGSIREITLSKIPLSTEEPSNNFILSENLCASIFFLLCDLISISIPKTRPRPPFSSKLIAELIKEPPLATPVSIIIVGFVSHITSCWAIISAGVWMIGKPPEDHKYEYLYLSNS